LLLSLATLTLAPACADSTSAENAPMVPAAGPAAEQLSGDQIWSVAEAINQGQVMRARVAVTRAQNAQVKEFAKRVLRSHQDEARVERDATKRIGLTVEPSPTSAQVVNAARLDVSYMQRLSRADFDRWYIARERLDRERTLDMIDRQLLPQAQDAELRADLLALRARVLEHYLEARRLEGELGAPTH
jgi:putative membrane protein